MVIALSARKSFLARPRKDYRKYKLLTDEELESRVLRLPTEPPIFHKLTTLQKACFLIGAETKRFCFFNDTGCVDGATLLETDEGPIRIDELERRGQSINVLSKTESGLRFVPASAPFKKGPTDLFEVQFASGRKMVVTARHRFLTDRGFVSCEGLVVGERLPRYELSLQQTSLGTSQQESLGDVFRSLNIPQDLMDHCCQYYHPYDGQLHQGLDTDPIQFPLFDEKVRPIQPLPLFEQRDGLGILSTSTLLDRIPSLLEDSDPYQYFSNDKESQNYQAFSGRQLYPFYKGERDQPTSNHPARIQQDSASEFYCSPQQGDHLYDNLLAFSTSSDCVIDVKYVRTDCYYDLHVPYYENYIAEGLCHHNTGKTLLAIALIRYFRKLGILNSCLVLVPNRINKYELAYELKKHSPKSSYLVLEGSTVDKWRALDESDALFVFETYAGLSWLASTKQEKRGKVKLTPEPKLIEKLCKRFGGLVCDESVHVGNHNALPFRICRKIAKQAEAVFTLTGTPFNRDPTLMWAQMYLVDGGETLGETIGLFRSIFCTEKVNYFSGFPEYTFNKKTQDQLNEFIANRSISYEADKDTLPTIAGGGPIRKFVKMPDDAVAYYNKFKEQLMAARGNYQEMDSAFIRMRQISSGFVGFRDDETGERADFEFPDNPKLDLLLSIIQNTKEEDKVIVFFDFTFSGEKIKAALDRLKIGNVLLYGKTKDVDAGRQQFMTKPKIKVLILQNRFGIGLNVQIAKYACFFESPVSFIMRKQCEGRVVRQHSQHSTVFVYDLLMEDTEDERILDFHKEGKDLREAIVTGKYIPK